MTKRAFQVIDEMNLVDTETGSKLVRLFPDVVSMNETKKGMHVTMGVPLGELSIAGVAFKGTQRIVLMVIDGAEFDKRMKEPIS